MKLSVVIATLNRLGWLKKCVDSVRRSCSGMDFETIVVDGGSRDGTLQWLHGQSVITIEQGAAYGACYAFNAGFYASEGDYVAGLNDDCVVVGDTLQKACQYLDDNAVCGQVAIPWHDVGDRDITVQHVIIGQQRAPCIYANFGVTRRWLGDAVGWWGNWDHYSGDCELSFQVLVHGYTVDELKGGQIDHFRLQDETRRICPHNQAFIDKWMRLDLTATKFIFSGNGQGAK